jgi:predicted DNA-binding transcriptional regulator YafY
MLVAWCTLRQDYRRFWVNGFRELAPNGERLPEPRRSLLHEWRVRNDLPDLS